MEEGQSMQDVKQEGKETMGDKQKWKETAGPKVHLGSGEGNDMGSLEDWEQECLPWGC